MGSYNGVVASLTKGGNQGVTTLLTGTSAVTVVDSVPQKWITRGFFAVSCTEGVSGTFSVNVVGAVGGATFLICGRTNISGVGSFPLLNPTWVGNSGSATTTNQGFPRPVLVNFDSAEDVSGFTASVWLAGEY